MELHLVDASDETEPTPPTPIDWVTGLRAEVDEWYGVMGRFDQMDLADVLLRLASFSARASELRVRLHRAGGTRADSIRRKEIDPFLEECDRQFKVFSRLQAIRQMEWELARGQG